MANIKTNQTYLSGQKGLIKNGERGESYSCEVSAPLTKLVPGDVVKLKDVAGAIPTVEKIGATTEEPFGVIAYGPIRNEHGNGDVVTVVSDYTILTLEASAAIKAGDKVMAVIAGSKIAKATATNYAIGIALQKATGDGDLIDVLLKAPVKIA